jgi:putative transposase
LARKNRLATSDYAHHVVNRGNDRRIVFRERFDYAAFVDLLGASVRRFDVRLYAFCLMPNHFHLVVQPGDDLALSAFMQSLTGQYACAFRRQTQTLGHGHVFQRRFWNAPLYDDQAFYTVMRYVEANPCRAHLVDSAAEWEWSSMRHRTLSSTLLSPLPMPLPPRWEVFVDSPLPESTLERIRRVTTPSAGRPIAGEHQLA